MEIGAKARRQMPQDLWHRTAAPIVQTAGRAAANVAARIHARAAPLGMSGVHRIYDFAAVCLPWSAPVSASVAAVIDLATADRDPGFPAS
jgi:hypothetical protein